MIEPNLRFRNELGSAEEHESFSAANVCEGFLCCFSSIPVQIIKPAGISTKYPSCIDSNAMDAPTSIKALARDNTG